MAFIAPRGQHPVFIAAARRQSAGHFTRFEAQFDTQYRTLDTHLQELTLQGRKLGEFAARM